MAYSDFVLVNINSGPLGVLAATVKKEKQLFAITAIASAYDIPPKIKTRM